MDPELTWSLDDLGEAVAALVRAAGLSGQELPNTDASADLHRAVLPDVGRWLHALVSTVNLEAEPVALTYLDTRTFLQRGAPAIVSLRGAGDQPDRFALLLRGGRRRVTVLDTRGRPRRLPTATLEAWMRAPYDHHVADALEPLQHGPLRRGRRGRKAVQALRNGLLGSQRLPWCWVLRPRPGRNFFDQLGRVGALRYGAWFLAAHVLEHALGLAAWWVIGAGALQGRLDWGWMLAWALLLLTRVPLGMLATWAQGAFAYRGGARLKQRVLAGILELDPSLVRGEGRGRLLGRVLETEAVEELALAGGLQALMAVVELAFAVAVITQGLLSLPHLALVFVWTCAIGGVGLRIHHLRQRWTNDRIEVTSALVEGMVGQRTRVAQQAPGRWHSHEDEQVARYAHASQRMDHAISAWLQPLPRLGLALGLAAIVPTMLQGPLDPGPLAISIGGLLLAHAALRRLTDGLMSLSNASIAWSQISALFHAAATAPSRADPDDVLRPRISNPSRSRSSQVLLEGKDVQFRYRSDGPAVLDGCSLQIRGDDKILLEGVSGSGKSTLGRLLTGLARPQQGVMLLHGLDFETLGREGWRAAVVAAPQFHDNHLFSGSMAFNLLMGRNWPPLPGDLQDAEQMCHALGLGELLERMPGGLEQPIGDTGWQLSHGEASRVYLARALLQHADLVVLDESFGALDPATVGQCLQTALEHSKALVVIAHP